MDQGTAERIATALEAWSKIAEENQKLCKEDLEFRREMATKAEGEKEMFMKLMFGGAQTQQPQTPPAPTASSEPEFRRRPRHA